jgi:ABC-2 type transport system permease protein
MAGTMVIAEKEMKDQFGSKRFIILFGFMILLSGLAAYQGVDYIKDNSDATFLFIFSGSRFSSSFIQIMVLFGPILGMALGFDSVNKERTTGTLSMLLGQPIFRDSVINGKFLAGAASLATIGIGTIAITVGLAIPMLGYGPSSGESMKIVVLSLLTVLYLVFWLSLGMLFSVIAKKTSTSILASIATWMFFSVVLGILANAIAGVMVPLPAGGFQGRTPGEHGGMGGQQMTDEFRQAMLERSALTNSINRLSPTRLFGGTANAILGVTNQFTQFSQGFNRVVPLGEALLANWASIVVLAVGLVISFAASYILFLRMEIRPGD